MRLCSIGAGGGGGGEWVFRASLRVGRPKREEWGAFLFTRERRVILVERRQKSRGNKSMLVCDLCGGGCEWPSNCSVAGPSRPVTGLADQPFWVAANRLMFGITQSGDQLVLFTNLLAGLSADRPSCSSTSDRLTGRPARRLASTGMLIEWSDRFFFFSMCSLWLDRGGALWTATNLQNKSE